MHDPHHLLRVTLNSVRDAVIVTDRSGCVLMVSPAAEAMTGWAEAVALGKPIEAVIVLHKTVPLEERLPAQSSEIPVPNPVHGVLRDGVRTFTEPLLLIGLDGRRAAVQAIVAPLNDTDGRPTGCVLVLHDLGEAQRLAERMAYMAQHDTVTGLPNRILLVDRLEQATKLADRLTEQLAVLFLEIDRFHDLSDTLGRTQAEEFLRLVAYRLTGALRESDTVCRLGADAFVILLCGLKSSDTAESLAAKLLAEIARPYAIGEHKIHATCSIGMSLYPSNASDAGTLMRLADGAMHQARNDGRNRYVIAAVHSVAGDIPSGALL